MAQHPGETQQSAPHARGARKWLPWIAGATALTALALVAMPCVGRPSHEQPVELLRSEAARIYGVPAAALHVRRYESRSSLLGQRVTASVFAPQGGGYCEIELERATPFHEWRLVRTQSVVVGP